jgi:hypothetical protein
MKKMMCVLAAVAMVAAVSTSCNKKCTCTTYAAGVVVKTQDDVELGDKKKCTDLNTFVDMPGVGKTGLECK